MKTRINADDFGISRGVNFAIREMFKENKLNSASIICGCGHFNEAIDIAKRNPNLKIGLHFNLSSGLAVSDKKTIPLLVDKNGRFKNGFLKLLFLVIFKKQQLQKEISLELEAQISLIEKHEIKLNHVDSHRHIHFIAGIFSLVILAAKKHEISTIRIINEKLSSPISLKILINGGLLKWLVLRFFGLINGSQKLATKTYFFSILNSCLISKELIENIKIPNGFEDLEIMIHPANPTLDAMSKNLEERKHLLSQNRVLENL